MGSKDVKLRFSVVVRCTHCKRIAAGEVDRDGAADGLTVQDLEKVSFRLFEGQANAQSEF